MGSTLSDTQLVKIIIFRMFAYMLACMRMPELTGRRSEGNFQGSLLSFYHVGLRVARLGRRGFGRAARQRE